ncbi:MAG: hypothetical protein HYX90_10335 [Chloroflexi bacterium]|nr:hypothetical protein [Chloroflexota bacterium]
MAGKLTAKRVFDELKKCGITHIVWLPDSRVQFMYAEMMSQRDIKLVPVCREGEAIAIATGLRIGGKNPITLHQNTGLFESGDSLRGIGLDFGLPLLMLIGYESARTDSSARFTRPILDTWKVKQYVVEADQDVDKISAGYKETLETKRPVAILIGAE